MVVHVPIEQTRPGAQTSPHVPQLFGSLCVCVQTPLHTAPPFGQPHVPPWHVIPLPVHAIPQPPQFAERIRLLLVHAGRAARREAPAARHHAGPVRAHGVRPAAVAASAAVQRVGQDVRAGTATEPESPLGALALAVHAARPPSADDAAPAVQLLSSVCSLTHPLPQSRSPAPQFVAHWPPEQTLPVVQASPQVPQLNGSDARVPYTRTSLPRKRDAAPWCRRKSPPSSSGRRYTTSGSCRRRRCCSAGRRRRRCSPSAPPRSRSPRTGLSEHTPAPQLTPHMPQLEGSLSGSTHSLPHTMPTQPVGEGRVGLAAVRRGPRRRRSRSRLRSRFPALPPSSLTARYSAKSLRPQPDSEGEEGRWQKSRPGKAKGRKREHPPCSFAARSTASVYPTGSGAAPHRWTRPRSGDTGRHKVPLWTKAPADRGIIRRWGHLGLPPPETYDELVDDPSCFCFLGLRRRLSLVVACSSGGRRRGPGMPTTTTGGGSCTAGAEGCSCYPNGTCNAGLSCGGLLEHLPDFDRGKLPEGRRAPAAGRRPRAAPPPPLAPATALAPRAPAPPAARRAPRASAPHARPRAASPSSSNYQHALGEGYVFAYADLGGSTANLDSSPVVWMRDRRRSKPADVLVLWRGDRAHRRAGDEPRRRCHHGWLHDLLRDLRPRIRPQHPAGSRCTHRDLRRTSRLDPAPAPPRRSTAPTSTCRAGTVLWSSFNTKCYDSPPDGTFLDATGPQIVTQVQIQVPSTASPRTWDFLGGDVAVPPVTDATMTRPVDTDRHTFYRLSWALLNRHSLSRPVPGGHRGEDPRRW